MGLLAAWAIAPTLWAEERDTTEIIRQLQSRVEELEQKVRQLESTPHPDVVPTNTTTPARLEELDQKVKVLERNRELDQEAAEAKAREAPKITLGDQGFAFMSANGNFGVQLKGVLQVDSRTFFDDSGIVGNDGLLLRRVRPIWQGTVFRDFDFVLMPDFAGSTPQLQDAYLNYKFKPELQLRAGKLKVPVGLEWLQADQYALLNERALVSDLVPYRDIGVQLSGDVAGGVFSYAAGVFNGVGDARNSNNSDSEDDKALAGRIFVQPFRNASALSLQGLGFGLGGSYEGIQGTNTSALPATTGGTLPGYATVGQQQFFAYNPTFVTSGTTRALVAASGDHWRLSPQAYYFYGPFSLLGEYALSDQKVTRTVAPPLVSKHLDHTAWQITGAWVMTGEDAAYANVVVPRKAFNPLQGGWGALQLVARYSELEIDRAAFPLFSDPKTSASGAQEWSVGLNWYLNRNVRVGSSFSHTTFDGAGAKAAFPPGVVTRKSENVLFTRMQLAF